MKKADSVSIQLGYKALGQPYTDDEELDNYVMWLQARSAELAMLQPQTVNAIDDLRNKEAEIERLRQDRQTLMDTKEQEAKILEGLALEVVRLRARIDQAIGLLEHPATVVDSGKTQALVVLTAAEAEEVGS